MPNMKNNEKKPKMIMYSNKLYNEVCQRKNIKLTQKIFCCIKEIRYSGTKPYNIYKIKDNPIYLSSYDNDSLFGDYMEEYDIIVFDMEKVVNSLNYGIILSLINGYKCISDTESYDYTLEGVLEQGKVLIILNYKTTDLSIDAIIDMKKLFGRDEELPPELKNNYSLLESIKISLEDRPVENLGVDCLLGNDFEKKELTEYFKSAKAYKILPSVVFNKENNQYTIDNKYPIIIIAKDIGNNIVSGAVRYGNNWVIYLPQSGLPIKEKIHTLYEIGKHYYKYINDPEGILKISSNKKVESQALLKTFPTPPNTKWKDVTIQVSENAMMTLVQEIKEVSKYYEIGFEDKRRRGYCDKQWKNLKKLAKNDGKLSRDSQDAEEEMQKSISSICKRLKKYMVTINERPIYYDKKMGAYITKFNIKLDSNLDREVEKVEAINEDRLEDKKKKELYDEFFKKL